MRIDPLLKSLELFFLLFFVYFILSYVYSGLTQPLFTNDDSVGYHIPIAKSIVDGIFLNPISHFGLVDNTIRYSPASSEAILAFFLVAKLPLNLYNVAGIIALFFSLFYLAKSFDIMRPFATIFAVSLAVMPVVARWANSQFVDIWYTVFFVLFLGAIAKPKNKLSYFVILGILAGMVIGSKYSGPPLLIVILIVFAKEFFKYLSINRFLVFSFFTFLFGGFWYLRNFLVTGNPYFPQNLFGFGKGYYSFQVWKAFITDPIDMISAYINEFSVLSLAIIIIPFILIYHFKKNKIVSNEVLKLLLVGALIIPVMAILPSEPNSFTHYVSTMRYFVPTVTCFVLFLFVIAQKVKKAEHIVWFSLLSIVLTPIPHNPKLLIIVGLLGLMLLSKTTIRKLITD